MQNGAIYLDYAATTPLAPEVASAMQDWLASGRPYANPASIHMAGRESAAAVAVARDQVARLLNTTPDCLIFTSGATESDNLAIQGVARAHAHRGKHLITMLTEHKAVVDTFKALERDGFQVSWLRPTVDGLLHIDAIANAIRPETQLVSVMHINNETGVIQDIREIGELCRSRGVLFHTDAAQSVGKLVIDLEEVPVDLLSFTAHKFYGPQGVGGLYIADRPQSRISPLLFGGGQERRLRPGTVPVHLVAGMGVAAQVAREQMQDDHERMKSLNSRLWHGLHDIAGVTRNGSPQHCYPGILNVSATGVEGESLMLGMEPVCAASGSACNSLSGESSYVLRGMGRSDLLTQSAVRFSFGRATTEHDIDVAIRRYRDSVDHLRSLAPPDAVAS
ncbi:MAG: cysteine desulfurase family protein [Woeseiaceae bacterium]